MSQIIERRAERAWRPKCIGWAALCLTLCACDSEAPSTALDGGSAEGGSEGGSEAGPTDAGADAADSRAAEAPTEPTAGETTGETLAVNAELNLRPAAGGNPARAEVLVVVAADGFALGDATVVITPQDGVGVELVEDDGIAGLRYRTTLEGELAPSYLLSVTHDRGSRTGIALIPPTPHTVEIEPAPKLNMASTVTWSPHDEPGVDAWVVIGSYGTPTSSPLPDDGAFELPEDTFTRIQHTTLMVQRARLFEVPREIATRAIVTVITPSISVHE